MEDKDNFDRVFSQGIQFLRQVNRCNFRHSDSHTQIGETENQVKYKVHGFQKGVNKRSIMSKCLDYDVVVAVVTTTVDEGAVVVTTLGRLTTTTGFTTG